MRIARRSGTELSTNHALTDDDVEHFVATLLAGLTAYPTYYAHMGAANLAGPGPADLAVPGRCTAMIFASDSTPGSGWSTCATESRSRADHLAGTASFEYGDGGSFTSYLGWVIPYGAGLTLIGDLDDVERAIRDLSRIGFDRPEVVLGSATRRPRPWLSDQRVPADGTGRARTQAVRTRRTSCSTFGGPTSTPLVMSTGAMNMPMPDVPTRMPELPRDPAA